MWFQRCCDGNITRLFIQLQLFAAYLSAFVVQMYSILRQSHLQAGPNLYIILSSHESLTNTQSREWPESPRRSYHMNFAPLKSSMRQSQKGEMIKANSIDMLIHDAINRGTLTAVFESHDGFVYKNMLAPFFVRLSTRQRIRDKIASSEKGWNSIALDNVMTNNDPRKIQAELFGRGYSALNRFCLTVEMNDKRADFPLRIDPKDTHGPHVFRKSDFQAHRYETMREVQSLSCCNIYHSCFGCNPNHGGDSPDGLVVRTSSDPSSSSMEKRHEKHPGPPSTLTISRRSAYYDPENRGVTCLRPSNHCLSLYVPYQSKGELAKYVVSLPRKSVC
ncbi:hypothetical protein DFH09DRAFT_1093830 [Mycena vulgaris]|nr:hypothetical protein DFH09DRAFT_1093830 [Mycena vulgaris]